MKRREHPHKSDIPNERNSNNIVKKTDIVLYLYLLVSVVLIMISDYIHFKGWDVIMFLWKGVLVLVMLIIAYKEWKKQKVSKLDNKD